ncbi:MAG: hypothetical protein MZV65_47405 [Chromatiales bacterium]|nr:hypothetical protein [Chromatiales bacterium]
MRTASAENATAAELYTQAYRQWREAVELDLQDSEDIVYGIMPLLIQGWAWTPITSRPWIC